MVEALKVECGQGYQHKNVTSANFRCEKFYTFRPWTTPQKEVWNVIRSLSGKLVRPNKIILVNNNISYSDPQILGHMLGTYFQKVSSTENCTRDFISYNKRRKEANVITFPNAGDEFYIDNFTKRKLKYAIK